MSEELTGNNHGTSLVEILIAMGVFSIAITAVILTFFGGQNFILSGRTSRTAVEKAHTGIEALRIIRDTNWSSMSSGLHGIRLYNGVWELTGSPDISDGFTRTVSLSTDIDGIMHADVIVSWQETTTDIKTVTMYETLAPPNQGLLGDWTQPCVLSIVNGSSGSKGKDVFYYKYKAFVASSASSADKEDLFIIDVLASRSPSILGTLNVEEGWKAIVASGNYAFGIEENSSEFFSVNVSNPAAPGPYVKLTLPNGGFGRTLSMIGHYVYAGTTNSLPGKEFFIIDVSNPLVPTVIGSLEIGADVNDISKLQNVAYLATSGDLKELVAVSVTNPAAPTQLGTYDATGSSDGTGVNAKTVNRIYLGRVNSPGHELSILDAINPAAITLRGSTDASGSVYGILTAGTLSFIGSDDVSQEFQNYYIRDPATITKQGQLNLSNLGTGADYYDNIVYMTVQNVDILNLITSTINGTCGG